MPRKPRQPMTAEQIITRLRDAALAPTDVVKNSLPDDYSELEPLEVRLQHILSLTRQPKTNPRNMLFFVMYDIESNKVRRMVAKYLLRQGCHRIQHSIYLADMPSERCEQIKHDLAEVQAAYDNHDSLLVVPISSDYLKAMKVIGRNLNVDIITHSQNTLFF